jgi:hypothetical protein
MHDKLELDNKELRKELEVLKVARGEQIQVCVDEQVQLLPALLLCDSGA